MDKTFKRPLIPRRTDFSLHGIFEDKGLKEVAEAYRKRFGGNPFGIKPDEPPKPVVRCATCGYFYNPNTGEKGGQCNGSCD